MAVFSRIGYTRTEARSRLFDVMWAHDYPFGGDLKEMLQTLEPHQKVRMHLPFLTIFLIYPPSPPTLLTHPPSSPTLGFDPPDPFHTPLQTFAWNVVETLQFCFLFSSILFCLLKFAMHLLI